MDIWNALREVPPNAKKTIKGGRLNGMTDINPVWRWSKMTERFGPCGLGWRFEIARLWTEAGGNGEIAAFAHVLLFLRDAIGCEWSDPIPGIGGSMLVAIQKGTPHVSDEAYKMAVTDALGTAAKMIGLGADVYWQGGAERTKYDDVPFGGEKRAEKPKPAALEGPAKEIADYFATQHLSMKRDEDKPTIRALLAQAFGGVDNWRDVVALPEPELRAGTDYLKTLEPKDVMA